MNIIKTHSTVHQIPTPVLMISFNVSLKKKPLLPRGDAAYKLTQHKS